MQTQQQQQHSHQQIVAGSNVILKMNETVVQQLSTVGESSYIYLCIMYVYMDDCTYRHVCVCVRALPIAWDRRV